MSYLLLLYIIVAILLFIAYYLNGRDIITPSVMMCIVFFLSIVVAILNIKNWNIKYSLKATIILSTGILVFVIADMIIYQISKVRKKNYLISKDEILKSNRVNIIDVELWKIVIIVIIELFTLIWQFLEIQRITGIHSLSNIGLMVFTYKNVVSYSTALSASELMSGMVNQLTKITTVTAFIYIFIIINNVIEKIKPIKLLKYIPSILIYFIQSVLTGGRECIFRTGCITIISVYVLYHQKRGWEKNITYKYIKLGIFMVFIILPIFWLSKDLMGRTTQKTIFEYLSFYAGGSIQHFNQYILDPPPANTVFGEESFVNIYTFLWKHGLSNFHRIIHLEFRWLNGYTRGNVYTFFRRLIQDFGITGMYIATFIIGITYSYIYHFKLWRQKKSYITSQWILIYSYIYYVILMSSIEQMIFGILSVASFTTLIMQFFMFWFFTSVNITNKFKIIVKFHKKKSHIRR
ncbi:oligosaccharide repeat unit polymerase [Enterocloster aldenensis]|uniref:O-antigen polymerase n=1 Tax=Enterocloster aldenensis TaxID=358742 RepID=UPI000E4DE1FA|nr:oligosaccharide repeat unit polymerase [Enterocloster aldenensis]